MKVVKRIEVFQVGSEYSAQYVCEYTDGSPVVVHNDRTWHQTRERAIAHLLEQIAGVYVRDYDEVKDIVLRGD